MSDFLGVVILESLYHPDILNRAVIVKESNINAPPGDPYPVWTRRLVKVHSRDIMEFADGLARDMKAAHDRLWRNGAGGSPVDMEHPC